MSLTLVVALGCATSGCVTARLIGVARKTQLENQLLGTFERLSKDLILASAVRADSPRARAARAKLTPLQREALAAMLRREFNRDDVDALKDKQVLGEGNDGMLKLLLTPKDPRTRKEAERLLRQDNADRLLIMRRAIDLSPDLSAKDMPLARRVFYRLNVQAAQPGQRIQRSDGSWRTVSKDKAGAAKAGGAKATGKGAKVKGKGAKAKGKGAR